jgi:hypothetical protein
MDREYLEKLFTKYPVLMVVFKGGVLSKKLVRELLDVDRWFMNDLYKEWVLCQLVKGVGSSYFKATDEVIDFIKEREANESL